MSMGHKPTRRLRARRRRLLLGGALTVAAALGTVAARAQLRAMVHSEPVSRDQPVFYQADSADYDRDGALVTLSGHVEIWQGDRILRADRVTYDRNTGVAAATGNVVLVEPDGQVLFAEYAELSEGMKDGVLRDMRALLPQNGRLVANGARRTDATINELSRAVYTTCNLCKEDPSAAPLWDIRARSVLQDVENHKIEYRDAVVDIYGVPVFYFPFMAHPDPSVRRASGILVPNMGVSTHLGAFFAVPYYWVIDDQSDATLTPILAAKQGGGLEVEYRQVFNSGKIVMHGSVASDEGGVGWHLFTHGDFSIDDTWRWGFDINRASSTNYLRDYMVPNGLVPVLTSSVWLEGFGQGSYSRLDVRAYQSILNGTVVTGHLPYVLPRYQYSYFGEPDALGGRLSVDTGAFNVVRETGTSTERARLSLDWQRPFTGQIGDQWKLTLHVDSAAYDAREFIDLPNFGAVGSVQTAQAMPTAATEVRVPLVRDAGSSGTQIIEPIAQLIVAPNGSKYGFTTLPNGTTVSTSRVPNEDSLDQELTDANLFALNRFPGVDRLEGGVRMNAGLHGAWNFPGGAAIDGLVGEGYRVAKSSPWMVGSGLSNQLSDVVSRLTFTPGSYFDLTGRARFDPHTQMSVPFGDILASAGPQALRVSAGYIYSSTMPYTYYDYPPTGQFWGATGKVGTSPTNPYPAPRNEIALGASTHYGPWRLSGTTRTNLRTDMLDLVSVTGAYEDECFIFNLTAYKRYTSINGDHGDSAVMFQITFKTVGEFGFHPM
jgi:LPS-assembly protein